MADRAKHGVECGLPGGAKLALVAFPALLACADATGPRLPAGAVQLRPLETYALWWEQTKTCASLPGDFDSLQWFEVPNASAIATERGHVQGMWLPGNVIVLAGESVRNGPLVRHEMLHALLQTTEHPRAEFIGRCEGVVVCETACRDQEPEPPAPLGTIAIPATDLEIAVTISPESPGRDVRDGHIQIIVTARNPYDRPVRIDLAPARDAGLPVTWRYSIWRGSAWWNHDERARVAESTRFQALQTKQMIYDLWITGAPWQEPFDPGVYDVYGAFNSNRTMDPLIMTIRETPICCDLPHRVR